MFLLHLESQLANYKKGKNFPVSNVLFLICTHDGSIE